MNIKLGSLEELVLLAIAKLRDAYGVSIREALVAATGKSVSFGAVYTALDQLERKGYVDTWMGEATAERGGRAKRFYQINGSGEQALMDADRARRALAPVGVAA